MCDGEIDQLRREVAGLRSDLQYLESKIADLERENGSLSSTVRKLESHRHYEIDDLRGKIDGHVSAMTPHRFGQ